MFARKEECSIGNVVLGYYYLITFIDYEVTGLTVEFLHELCRHQSLHCNEVWCGLVILNVDCNSQRRRLQLPWIRRGIINQKW